MSYDISFRVKVEGIDRYIPVGNCDANITWNVRDIITKSTGLKWDNESNNGYVKDIIPFIQRGYDELNHHPDKYKALESPNGWGTVEGTRKFFKNIIESWYEFCEDYFTRDLKDVVTFWIV